MLLEIIRIKDIKIKQKISGILAVKNAEVRSKKTGNGCYCQYILTDGVSNIIANKWDIADINDYIKPDSVVIVQGKGVEYDGKINITLDSIILGDQKTIDSFSHYNGVKMNQLYDEITLGINSLQDIELRKVCQYLYNNNKESLLIKPAAVRVHHDYKGGLLVHTYEVYNNVLGVISRDPRYNKDLAIAGAVLHDIGKVVGYDIGVVATSMTDSGKLFDHIVIGFEMINDAIRVLELQVTENVKLLLNLVLSHHGKLEYGSPVLCKTPEAFLVHTADQLSATSCMMFNARDNGKLNSVWTGKIGPLGSDIYIATQE